MENMLRDRYICYINNRQLIFSEQLIYCTNAWIVWRKNSNKCHTFCINWYV